MQFPLKNLPCWICFGMNQKLVLNLTDRWCCTVLRKHPNSVPVIDYVQIKVPRKIFPLENCLLKGQNLHIFLIPSIKCHLLFKILTSFVHDKKILLCYIFCEKCSYITKFVNFLGVFTHICPEFWDSSRCIFFSIIIFFLSIGGKIKLG